MCPVCLCSAAWLMTGGISVLGGTAGGVAIVRDRKIATRISKIWKLRARCPGSATTNEKRRNTWRRTKQETCSTPTKISE
jgi:hypothetical protein